MKLQFCSSVCVPFQFWTDTQIFMKFSMNVMSMKDTQTA
jgi:hypothetical protein